MTGDLPDPPKASPEEAIDAAVKRLVLAALDVFVEDQHRWSARPCGTCRQISAIVGRSWGCIAYAEQQKGGMR